MGGQVEGSDGVKPVDAARSERKYTIIKKEIFRSIVKILINRLPLNGEVSEPTHLGKVHV